MRSPLKDWTVVIAVALSPFIVCGVGSCASEAAMANEDRLVLFRFEPKKVLLDHRPQFLQGGWLRFPPGNKVYLLEYERPDGSWVKAELYSRRDDGTDVHMEVKLDGITGLPKSRILSIVPKASAKTRPTGPP